VKALRLAEKLESRAQSFVIRTVFSRKSVPGLAGLGTILSRFQHLRRWSLVQFGAIEDGYRNRAVHELSDEDFVAAARRSAAEYMGPAQVNVYPNTNKIGVYFLIGPGGDVFGDVAAGAVSNHPIVGNILLDHAKDIAPRLGIRAEAHQGRYLTLMST
jgi:hypothetical protein